jgi:acyl-coenzyme A synthetase/AMP-(fatty) acid ligase
MLTPRPLRDLLLTGGRAPATPVTPEISWGRFQADVAGLSLRLAALGVRRGGLWCKDSYAFAVGLLGLAQAGCATILLPSAQPGLLANLQGAWDAMISDELAGAIPPLAEPVDPPATRSADACAVEFFTSGSTGQAKRIVRSLDLLEREAAALENAWGAPHLGVTHATVPHQHAYGLPFKILWPLVAGRPFSPCCHDIWESLPDRRDIVVISSPAHLSRLGGLERRQSPALIFSAGAPLTEAAADDARRVFGVTPTEIFGSTETGVIARRRGRSAWQPMPDNQVSAGSDGRLHLISPWVGVPHQGSDAIEISADGSFTLKGRLDRIVKINGKRVCLTEVEEALIALPQVSEAAAMQIDGDLAAVVVPTAQGWSELAALREFRFGRSLRTLLADRFEPTARPRRWRYVAEIPVTSMGKRCTEALARLFDEAADA